MRALIQFIKSLLSNNLILKCTALLIAFATWLLLAQHRFMTMSFNVPVCLYNEPEHCTVDAPEKMILHLYGKWIDLAQLNENQLAVHIDYAQLKNDTNCIMVNDQHVFLPTNIKLIDWSPTPLKIIIKNQESTECKV